MVRIVYISLLLIAPFMLNGQSLMNTGILTVQDSAILYIDGDFNLESTSTDTAVINSDGDIYVNGDWINESGKVFTDSSDGLVTLSGGDQQIEGTFTTSFPNLVMKGNDALKEVLTNTNVVQILDIENVSVQTYDKVLTLQNPDPNALLYQNGFIHSELAGGYFRRATSAQEEYIFPLGSYQLSNTYRPLAITPSIQDTQYFAVRLASLDPSFEDATPLISGLEGPFPLESFNEPLSEINENFYFNIFGQDDPAAVISIYHFETDGEFTAAANWNPRTMQWEKVLNSGTDESNISSFNAPDRVIKLNKSDLLSEAVNISSTSDLFYTQLITPNQDLKNDEFYIEGADKRDNDHIKIFNRWGANVYESDNYQNDWDGVADKGFIPLKEESEYGLRVPPGAYFFEYQPNADSDFVLSGYFHVHY